LGEIPFIGFVLFTRFSGRTDLLTDSLTDGQTQNHCASGTKAFRAAET